MKQLVCESLQSFYKLNENMETALKAFKDAGYVEGSPEWNIFIQLFSKNPNALENFVGDKDDINDFIDTYNEAKNLNVEIPTSFISFDKFLRQLQKNIDTSRKAQIGTLTAAQEENIKLAKELQDLKRLIDDPEIIIKKLDLKPVAKGLYVTPYVLKKQKAFDVGQGLYIWTDSILLKDWNGRDTSLKTKFKFGQYGSNVKGGLKKDPNLNNEDDNINITAKDLQDATGVSGKTAMQTIESYSGTSIGVKVIIDVFNLTEELKNHPKYKKAIQVEQEVREAILRDDKKTWTLDTHAKSKEVYYGGTLKELKQEINGILTGVKKQDSYSMRPEQITAHDKIISSLAKDNKKEFLLAAKMRFGKNFTLLNAVKKLNELHPDGKYKNTLVITYKPAVFDSLQKDIENHTFFNGWQFIDIRDNVTLVDNGDNPRIFACSAQWALHKGKKVDPDDEEEDYDEEEKEARRNSAIEEITKNLSKLQSIKFGLVIADEYHYGTKTKNFTDLIDKKIKPEKIIYVSGTAMKDLSTRRFDDKDLYTWSYIDEQKHKNEEKKQKEEDIKNGKLNGYYPHLEMPTMNFYKIDIHPDVINEAKKHKVYTVEQGFDFKKLIDIKDPNSVKTGKVRDEDVKLVNELLMQKLLEQIMGSQKYGHLNSVMLSQEVEGGLDHTFWVLNKSVAGIKATANLMRSKQMQHIFGDYEIIEATGDKNTSIKAVKQKIKNAKYGTGLKKKSITLSCYRFKEGTTVPWWNGVVMLDGGSSPEEYLQAIFRSQNPNPRENKDKCYVFDFNPERLLSLYYDIANWNKDPENKKATQSEIIENYLTYAPILQSDGNKLVPMNPQHFIDYFISTGDFPEKMANDRVFDIDAVEKIESDDDLLLDLAPVSSEKNSKNIHVNKQGLEKAKKSIRERIPKEGEEPPDEEQKRINLDVQKEKIRNILRRIPTFLFSTEEDERSIDHVIELCKKDKEIHSTFKEICGVDVSVLEKLLDRGYVLRDPLNKTMEFFSKTIKDFEKEPTAEKANEFITKHMILRSTEVSTPLNVVNEMLDKLPSQIWKNKNSKFCDPVCGTGMFLTAIKDRLMKNLIGQFSNNKDATEEHIMKNMVYGVDKSNYKTIIAKKLLGNKSYNIINKNSLKPQTWENMPEFDAVVQNPPYQGTKHLQFLELGYNILKKEGKMVIIEPSNWLIWQKPTDTNEKYEKIKEKLEKNIQSIKFAWAPDLGFSGITIYYPMSITYIDKAVQTNTIEFQFLNEEPKIVKTIKDVNLIGDHITIKSIQSKIALKTKSSLNDFVNKQKKNYFVNLNSIGGNGSMTTEFYDGIERNFRSKYNLVNSLTNKVMTEQAIAKPQGKRLEGNPKNYVSFDNKIEAENFLKYITKTKLVKFLMILYTIGQHVDQSYYLIPWMNFKTEWTDDKLNTYFGLEPNDIKLINDTVDKFTFDKYRF